MCPSGSAGSAAEGHPREAVRTALGHVSVPSLCSSRVRHGNKPTERRLGDYILAHRRKEIVLLVMRAKARRAGMGAKQR